MADVPKNLRNMKIAPSSKTPDTGKNMTTTAVEGSDWNSKNETVEYSHSEKPQGPFGGLNSGT